jgi:hypothetical protein
MDHLPANALTGREETGQRQKGGGSEMRPADFVRAAMRGNADRLIFVDRIFRFQAQQRAVELVIRTGYDVGEDHIHQNVLPDADKYRALELYHGVHLVFLSILLEDTRLTIVFIVSILNYT